MTAGIITGSAAFEAFRGFIVLALSELNNVMYAAPKIADPQREPMPYATVKWLRSRALSSTPFRRVGDEVDPEHAGGLTHEDIIQQAREGVVQLTLYGDEGPDLLESLPTRQMQLDERAYLTDEYIATRPLGDVLDTRELRDTVYEASAMQEWAVIYSIETIGRIGIIKTAVADMTYTG